MIDQAMSSPAKWLRNAWQAAALSGEIGEQLFARTFLDEPVVLWRTPAGEVRALADRCAHRFVPLSAGRLDDGIIECGYHGMRFDETGACVGVPGQASVAPRATVRSYPVTEMHGLVWIWMGDPQRSRAAVVPDVRWRELAGWKFIGGYEHVAADYRLLNDNLLDLSHESFVHRDTIGNHAVADAPFEVETIDDRVVKLHRDMLDCDPPPSYRGTNGTGKIDRWHTTYFTPPGYHLNYNGSKPAGAPMDAAREGRVMHLLTPETGPLDALFLRRRTRARYR